jgi:parallel beta-helix repeat protein
VNIAGTTAAVVGQVASTTGGDVEYWAQYGPTTAYGSETAHATVEVGQNGSSVVRRDITGLTRRTTYHARLCAQDSQQQGGPQCGDDVQFTTVNVDCGDPLTTNVTLSASLDCTARGPALVIRADGINLNLGGHTVNGGGSLAIDNTGGYDDVTIHDGAAKSFGDTVVLDGASRNVIRGLSVLIPGPFGEGGGLEIRSGEANVVLESHVDGGLGVVNSTGVVIAHSGVGGGEFSSAIGIQADLARVHDNAVSAFRGAGILVNGSSNRILRNHSIGSAAGGINIAGGAGNVVADNELLNGVFPTFGTVEGPYADGIFVAVAASGTRVRGNTANQNAGDGIESQSTSSRLGGNSANDNGDVGIDAAAGVTDLGGNAASGNGNPLQCRNVFCQ